MHSYSKRDRENIVIHIYLEQVLHLIFVLPRFFLVVVSVVVVVAILLSSAIRVCLFFFPFLH